MQLVQHCRKLWNEKNACRHTHTLRTHVCARTHALQSVQWQHIFNGFRICTIVLFEAANFYYAILTERETKKITHQKQLKTSIKSVNSIASVSWALDGLWKIRICPTDHSQYVYQFFWPVYFALSYTNKCIIKCFKSNRIGSCAQTSRFSIWKRKIQRFRCNEQ